MVMRMPFEPPAGYPEDRRWPRVAALVRAAGAGVITEDEAVDKILWFWTSWRHEPDRLSRWLAASRAAGVEIPAEVLEVLHQARTEAAPRTFTAVGQPASHIWRMTGTELNTELAKAWDAGWRERSLEEERQRTDPKHLIFRHNPYRQTY